MELAVAMKDDWKIDKKDVLAPALQWAVLETNCENSQVWLLPYATEKNPSFCWQTAQCSVAAAQLERAGTGDAEAQLSPLRDHIRQPHQNLPSVGLQGHGQPQPFLQVRICKICL